jgi:hypothetical protein
VLRSLKIPLKADCVEKLSAALCTLQNAEFYSARFAIDRKSKKYVILQRDNLGENTYCRIHKCS